MSYKDLGLSGFRGDNARTGELAVFLEAIKLGKVQRGSILIVEALERLTRDDIDEALDLFLGIIRDPFQFPTGPCPSLLRRLAVILPDLVFDP